MINWLRDILSIYSGKTLRAVLPDLRNNAEVCWTSALAIAEQLERIADVLEKMATAEVPA